MRTQSPLWLALLVLCGLIAACGGNGEPSAEATQTPDLVDSAAAEATALLVQARATAIVLEARAQATALVEQARHAGGTPTSAVLEALIYPSATPNPSSPTDSTPETEGESTVPEGEEIPVQVTGVGFAAEGGMIMVRFLAPPEEAAKWWQGSVSVTDEGNGAVYNEIPVMPKVGPLIGRPKVAGQPGYVMLINVPPYLRPGAMVTAVLGTHQFEHIPVQ